MGQPEEAAMADLACPWLPLQSEEQNRVLILKLGSLVQHHLSLVQAEERDLGS